MTRVLNIASSLLASSAALFLTFGIIVSTSLSQADDVMPSSQKQGGDDSCSTDPCTEGSSCPDANCTGPCQNVVIDTIYCLCSIG